MYDEFWRNPYINGPCLTILVVLIDEFMLRRNPHWALAYSAYSLCYIPLGALFIWPRHVVSFTIVKCISITIPVLVVVLFRLANVSVNSVHIDHDHNSKKSMHAQGSKLSNTNNTITFKDTQSQSHDHEMKIPISLADEKNIRQFERKRVYYHCLISPKLIIFLRKHLLTKKANHYFNVFIYWFLSVNIFEAMFFETMLGESVDGKYDWAKVFNILTGACLIITIPRPFKNSNTRQYYYFDTNCRYTDYIVDFGCQSHWFWQIIWVTLYTSWDWVFITRYFGYDSFWHQMGHLLPPMVRSYFYNNKNGAICGIYLQSRANVLMIYMTLIFVFRNDILQTKMFEYKKVQYGLPLMIWSICNFICAFGYSYWWFRIKAKQLQLQLQTKNRSINQGIDTIVAVELNQCKDVKSIQIAGN